MDYVYDIVLNFHKNYYEYYEWKTKDKIINVKKISLIKINNKDYLNLKYNDVIISYKDKMFLVTNGVEVMGIIIDNDGKLLKRSSLIFEESDDILDCLKCKTISKITYKKNIEKEKKVISRIEQEKREYIDAYFSKIDKEKDEYLLKYIYYDIFNEEENNINKLYTELVLLKDSNINKLYTSIKKIRIH